MTLHLYFIWKYQQTCLEILLLHFQPSCHFIVSKITGSVLYEYTQYPHNSRGHPYIVRFEKEVKRKPLGLFN